MNFKINNQLNNLYFVTSKICGGKRVFFDSQYAYLILDSWKFLRKEKRIKLYAFTVMPNHVHFIMKPCKNWTASQICFDFESYTAHEILKKLKKDNKDYLIDYFQKEANKLKLKDRKHKIWQDLQAKNIESEGFLIQKIEYIHSNACRKGWNLVDNRADYEYSSACFYDKGIKPIIEIDDLNEVLN